MSYLELWIYVDQLNQESKRRRALSACHERLALMPRQSGEVLFFGSEGYSGSDHEVLKKRLLRNRRSHQSGGEFLHQMRYRHNLMCAARKEQELVLRRWFGEPKPKNFPKVQPVQERVPEEDIVCSSPWLSRFHGWQEAYGF